MKTLPDISKWNTENVTDISYLFSGCSSLNQLPDINKWNFQNINHLKGCFNKCDNIVNYPDISGKLNNSIVSSYNSSNDESMSSMSSFLGNNQSKLNDSKEKNENIIKITDCSLFYLNKNPSKENLLKINVIIDLISFVYNWLKKNVFKKENVFKDNCQYIPYMNIFDNNEYEKDLNYEKYSNFYPAEILFKS